ncbi:MAG: DUF1015 family protein [Chryseobacterium sp.]|nr:MAG: DUF1015 family protein [Chryseobacterium sp.]
MATIESVHASFDTSQFRGDNLPALWIYSSSIGNKRYTGIWCLTDLVDMDNGKIIIHEKVLSKKVNTLLQRAIDIDISSSPVLLTYYPDKEIDEIVAAICSTNTTLIFEQDHVEFKLWEVAEPARIEKLQHAFSRLSKVFVADGHHRLAAAQSMPSSRRLLSSLYVSSDQINISAFHRLICLDSFFGYDDLLTRLKAYFDVHKLDCNIPYRPDQKHVIGLYVGKSWYRLELKANNQSSKRPDVTLLQDIILAPMLGIIDPGKDQRIINFPDYQWKKMVALLAEDDKYICFTLFPMSVADFFEVAESRFILPPKSTWIDPKIPEHLLMHSLQPIRTG